MTTVVAGSATESAPVAVLGLGAMGLPMAARLAGAGAVTGFDIDPGRRALAEAVGCMTFESAALAVEGAAVSVVAVRTLAEAVDCLFGDGGAAAAMPSGGVVLLTSTVGAAGAREIGERLSELGVLLLDAPVSGGPVRAGNGDLLVLAGGPRDAFHAARTVLGALASSLVHAGPAPGDGQSLKVVNQLLCGVHIAAAAEALVLAERLGIDPARVVEALGAGAAASFMFADRGPRIVEQLAGESPEVRSRLDIFVKDMGLVADAAADVGVELPVATAARDLYLAGERKGLASGDDSGVALVLTDA
ncbi:MAG: NAD(P)-dependent oxidoreductase [Gaiellales bacterium]